MTLPRAVCIAAIMASFLLVCACAGRPAGAPPRSSRAPADFTIDIAVFAPPDLAGLPEDLRAGVYVLEPGGMVRSSVGRGAIDRGYPAFTGRMSPARVDLLWRLVQDSGLLEADNASRVSASEVAGQRWQRSVAVVVLTMDGRHRWYRVSLDVATPDAAAARSLIAALAAYRPRR